MGNNVYMIVRDTGVPVPYLMPSRKFIQKEEELGPHRILPKSIKGESSPDFGGWK